MDSDEGATARRTERRRRLLGYAALGATLVLGAVLILVVAGFRSLDVAAYPLPVQRPTTWEEILARPRPVTAPVFEALEKRHPGYLDSRTQLPTNQSRKIDRLCSTTPATDMRDAGALTMDLGPLSTVDRPIRLPGRTGERRSDERKISVDVYKYIVIFVDAS